MTRTHAPPPPALEVRLAPGVRVRDGGRLLCGGTPFRLLRLSGAGAGVVARWEDGGRVGEAPAARALARRLLDAGLLLSDPRTTRAEPALDVVVPVRDRPHELRRCLGALAAHAPSARVVVVDDGSARPHDVAAIAAEHGAAVVRRPAPGGPAAARNAGLAQTSGPLVAFVDSDVVVAPGCLARLAAHFGDPAVGAAAPRVLALEAGGSALARYEAVRSSLDMGPRAASAAPATAVPYVPSTTLVVRRAAVRGGFDERLRVGEDVDFAWRMVAGGWRVAYDPLATVRHDHRVRPGAFWRRRWDYARSIGPLARRHPHALPAVRIEPWSAAILGLLVARRPAPAAALTAVRLLALRRLLAPHAERPCALAVELLSSSLAGTVRGAGHAVRRTWSPALLLTAPRVGAARRLLLAAAALELLDDRRRAQHAPLALADDLVAALGTWAGCVAARTTRPLRPSRSASRGSTSSQSLP